MLPDLVSIKLSVSLSPAGIVPAKSRMKSLAEFDQGASFPVQDIATIYDGNISR